tara:strand:- start:130 stop:1926 length:1797 start_codon:yes stop_codon:yes gene_type:complete
MILSLFFILVSLFFLQSSISADHRISKPLLVLLLFGNLFFLASYAFLKEIFGEDIAEALVFHFVFGVKGVGFKEYIYPTIIFLFFLYFLFLLMRNFFGFINNNKTKIAELLFGTFLLASSVSVNPFFLDMNKFLTVAETSIDESLFYDQKITYTKENKNIIFLYLEQIERTYLDKELFPDLMPNLSNLEKEAITFTNISIPKATNWTVGGMAASQCGVPLYTPIASQNSMSGVDQFMPLAKCLGDILKDAGYTLSYMGGADKEFGGKDKFYLSHGFTSVEGWKELKPLLSNPKYRSPWGIYDDELLRLVLERAKNLNKHNSPFGLVALTLDTHHPNGYLSQPCKTKNYQDGTNNILNSVHCADMLVGDFIKQYKESSLFESTILVVLSDHLALKNTASDILRKGDRKNLFLIFGKGLKPTEISLEGNLFDIGPTALGFVGTDTKGISLGRNLFFEESISRDELDDVIEKNKKRILELWSFPQMDKGLRLDSAMKLVHFGERFVKYPALILVDKDAVVSRIMFEFYYSLSLERHVNRLPENQNYIWIDKCQIIGWEQAIENQYCIKFQNNQTKEADIWQANNNVFTKNQIRNFFEEKKQ